MMLTEGVTMMNLTYSYTRLGTREPLTSIVFYDLHLRDLTATIWNAE